MINHSCLVSNWCQPYQTLCADLVQYISNNNKMSPSDFDIKVIKFLVLSKSGVGNKIE